MLKGIRASICALALIAASTLTVASADERNASAGDLAQLSAALEGKAPAPRALSFDDEETPYEACFRLCREYWQEECPEIGRENCEEGYQRCYENCWW